MMRRFGRSVVIAALFLMGCAPAETPSPLPTIDLPTAVPPVGRPSDSTWAMPFELSFPDGFWTEGQHEYSYLIHCPPTQQENLRLEGRFVVAADTPLMEGQTVFLRIAGLSIDRLGAPTVTTIHPEQPTVAVVTIAGIAEEDLEQVRNECGVLMSWDLHPVEVLQPQEPFQP